MRSGRGEDGDALVGGVAHRHLQVIIEKFLTITIS
jgi:hypothetical protein